MMDFWRVFGVAQNLDTKLPSQLETLTLDSFNFEKFPDFSAFENMTTLYLNHYPWYNQYGLGTNLKAKIPPNVESLTLFYFKIDELPNLVNFTQMDYLYFSRLEITYPNASFMLPTGLQSLRLEYVPMETFPNLGMLYELSDLHFSDYDTYVYNIKSDQLPPNVENLQLMSNGITLDPFSNFDQFPHLKSIHFRDINIQDKYSFVTSQLPPNLQSIRLEEMGLKGVLNFTQLLAEYNIYDANISKFNSSSINSIILLNVNFDIVDFRGLDDKTFVQLDEDIACALESKYPGLSISQLKEYICTRRRESHCTGETDCLNTCQCFKLPDDWQPSLNDFYTYVIFINLLC